jgi:hypothetical protein
MIRLPPSSCHQNTILDELDLERVDAFSLRRRNVEAFVNLRQNTVEGAEEAVDCSDRGNFPGERARLYRPRDGVNEPVQVVSVRNSTVPVQIRRRPSSARGNSVMERKFKERERERERRALGEYLRDL